MGRAAIFLRLAKLGRRGIGGALRVFVLACIGVSVVAAQAPAAQKGGPAQGPGELDSDRPDFTDSTTTVPRGWWQWESGFLFERSGSERDNTYGLPLVRIGLTRRFELRLGTDGVVGVREGSGPWHAGMADGSIGAKFTLREESRRMPAIALEPNLSLPWGNRAFSSGDPAPEIKLALDKDHVAGFGVGGNINYTYLVSDGHRFHQNALSLSIDHDVAGPVSAFGEVYTLNKDEPDGRRIGILQGGLKLGLGERGQLDVIGGRRITSAGPDWTFGFGWVLRGPLPGFGKP